MTPRKRPPPRKRKLKTSLKELLATAEREQKRAKIEAQKEAAIEQHKQIHAPVKPDYVAIDRILLIGEGNFSFARSLAENYFDGDASRIVATSFDKPEVMREKYSEEGTENVEAFKSMGGTVLFGIDATRLNKYKKLKGHYFTKIIFNFPHHGLGIKDQDHNVRANQLLLKNFWTAAKPLLAEEGRKYRIPRSVKKEEDGQVEEDEDEEEGPEIEEETLAEGEIHVTVKTCAPYHLWDVKKLAKTTGDFAIKTTLAFHPSFYPGYEHRRTLGFKTGVSKGGNEEILASQPKTFIIVRKEAMAEEREKARIGAIEKKKDRQREKLLTKKKKNKRVKKDEDEDDNDDE